MKKPDYKEIIDKCYELCESCYGLRVGHEPLVQNYLEKVKNDSENSL